MRLIFVFMFIVLLSLTSCSGPNKQKSKMDKVADELSRHVTEISRLAAEWGEPIFNQKVTELAPEDQEVLFLFFSPEYRKELFGFFVYDNQSFPTYEVRQFLYENFKNQIQESPRLLNDFKRFSGELERVSERLKQI